MIMKVVGVIYRYPAMPSIPYQLLVIGWCGAAPGTLVFSIAMNIRTCYSVP